VEYFNFIQQLHLENQKKEGLTAFLKSL
jgi:hypothetical protein